MNGWIFDTQSRNWMNLDDNFSIDIDFGLENNT